MRESHKYKYLIQAERLSLSIYYGIEHSESLIGQIKSRNRCPSSAEYDPLQLTSLHFCKCI